MGIAAFVTEAEFRRNAASQFSIITTFMFFLAIIVAVVGGIALMGALSISVVERTKEIGVLRAIGARTRTIMSMFVMEAILQGWLSWMIAVLILLVLGIGAFIFIRSSSDSRLRRRRRRSHSPLMTKTRRPTVHLSVRPPKD